jgi:hypothetical protein
MAGIVIDSAGEFLTIGLILFIIGYILLRLLTHRH